MTMEYLPSPSGDPSQADMFLTCPFYVLCSSALFMPGLEYSETFLLAQRTAAAAAAAGHMVLLAKIQ